MQANTTVIEVARIAFPDYLDSEDIELRQGSVIDRSHLGRWASRLSLSATDFVTARLAQRVPGALVTDEPQTARASYRLLINVSRLDIAGDGIASLQADWLIVPGDPSLAFKRDRAGFRASGPVATDEEVVALYRKLLEQLAAAIQINDLR